MNETHDELNELGEVKRRHWNYRLMRFTYPNFGDQLAIHEVYYGDDGRPDSYTADAVGVVGDSIVDIETALDRMRQCIAKPVLTPEDFARKPSPPS